MVTFAEGGRGSPSRIVLAGRRASHRRPCVRSRLPGREVDVALELYRDPELVRLVRSSVSLPENAERVAISLDDPTLGPFLA